MDELDAQIARNKIKRDHSADQLEFEHYEAKLAELINKKRRMNIEKLEKHRETRETQIKSQYKKPIL